VGTSRKQKKRSLSSGQRRFLDEYLSGVSGAEAARRAAYSARNARQQAHDLLTKPHIRTLIAEAPKPRHLLRAEVIAGLGVLARTSIKDLWDGKRMMLPDELPDEGACTVKKFKVHPNGAVEIEMYDKLKPLGLLSKIYGLLAQRPERVAKVGGLIEAKSTVVPSEEILTDEQRAEKLLRIALLLKSIERDERIGVEEQRKSDKGG